MKERKVRVFISSTFKDMDGERNYLNDYVFPQIREYCEKRYIDFTPIDLRWGITEEDSRSGLVLAACMEEVDNSRPFFIGILGGRYGWTPRIEDVNCCRPVITQNQDWLLEKITNSASITEIEMEYAILHKNAIKHASFFIKDDRVELPQEYREVKNSLREKKLLALKAKIRNQQKYPVHNYTSNKEMGDILLQELKDMIDQEFPPIENEYGNAVISRHEHSLLQHAETLYSYGDDCKKYFELWGKNQYETIHFDGPAGTGTSNILANLVLYVREHFSAKVLYYDFENADPNKNLMDDFLAFLEMPENKVDTSKWSMLGIDNASILSKDEAQQMRLWLMKKDTNLHVVIAASGGIMSSVLNATPCTTLIIENGLSAQRQREFIINYAKKHGKTLTPAQIEKIANGQNSNDVSILKLTLNTIINYGSFEGLSDRINQVVSKSNDPIYDTHIFDVLISELESILQEERLTEWFKKIITIVAMHGLEGISERNLLSYSQIPMEKWAILRPIISQFCHCIFKILFVY